MPFPRDSRSSVRQREPCGEARLQAQPVKPKAELASSPGASHRQSRPESRLEASRSARKARTWKAGARARRHLTVLSTKYLVFRRCLFPLSRRKVLASSGCAMVIANVVRGFFLGFLLLNMELVGGVDRNNFKSCDQSAFCR